MFFDLISKSILLLCMLNSLLVVLLLAVSKICLRSISLKIDSNSFGTSFLGNVSLAVVELFFLLKRLLLHHRGIAHLETLETVTVQHEGPSRREWAALLWLWIHERQLPRALCPNYENNSSRNGRSSHHEVYQCSQEEKGWSKQDSQELCTCACGGPQRDCWRIGV